MNTCDLSTWEVKAGRAQLRPAYDETPPQKKKKKTTTGRSQIGRNTYKEKATCSVLLSLFNI